MGNRFQFTVFLTFVFLLALAPSTWALCPNDSWSSTSSLASKISETEVSVSSTAILNHEAEHLDRRRH